MTNSKGVCIWFTGRSGAGKSTITKALTPLLDECGRTITLLDVVPLLGKKWCEKTSEGKLLRKSFVAREVVRHGGVAICVTVSARSEVREAARRLIGPEGFVEVFVDVPPEVSEARRRQRKQKARPFHKQVKFLWRRFKNYLPLPEQPSYETPSSPDLTLDSRVLSPEESAQAIFQLLLDRGFVVLEDNRQDMQAKVETVEI